MADAAASPNFASVYNPLIQQNTAAPPNPLVTAGQIQGLQQGAQSLNSTELDNATKRLHLVHGEMGALATIPGGPSMQDVMDRVQGVVSSGAMHPNEVASMLPNIPGGDGPQANAARKGFFDKQLQLTGSYVDKMAAAYGQQGAVGTGAGTQFYRSDPRNPGAIQPQSFSRNYLSPDAAVSPQAGPPGPGGAPTSITAGQRAEQAGLAAPGTYTGQGGSGAIPVTVGRGGQIVQRPMQQGAQQPSMAPPTMQPSAQPAAPSAPPGAPMQTGVSPAQAIALKGAGDQYASAGQNAATYGQQNQQLQSALTGLQNTNTGPGTEARQAIASYMLALPGGVGNYLPGVDPKSIAAYDEANKYLSQAAQGSSPNATRSDAGLNTALASSPSVHISNAAAQDVLKANIGFRRAEMAHYAAFQKTGQDPGQFTNFVAQRNQAIDPRAYSVDLLSQPQRQAFIGSLSGPAKTKFLSSVRDGIGNGMIDPQALSGGAGGR